MNTSLYRNIQLYIKANLIDLSDLVVFCKPINCPSIVLVVAFLCKCLTALLDGATSDGRERSVSRYSQQKTLNVAKSPNAKHPSFRQNNNPELFVCFEAMKTF